MRGLTAAGPTPPSNEVLVHVGVPTAPSSPTSVLGLVQGSALALSWTLPGAAAATSLMLDVSGSASLSLPLTARTVSGVVGPGSYTLRVRSTSPCGQSALTPPAMVAVS